MQYHVRHHRSFSLSFFSSPFSVLTIFFSIKLHKQLKTQLYLYSYILLINSLYLYWIDCRPLGTLIRLFMSFIIHFTSLIVIHGYSISDQINSLKSNLVISTSETSVEFVIFFLSLQPQQLQIRLIFVSIANLTTAIPFTAFTLASRKHAIKSRQTSTHWHAP